MILLPSYISLFSCAREGEEEATITVNSYLQPRTIGRSLHNYVT